jgi:hypothetical protein
MKALIVSVMALGALAFSLPAEAAGEMALQVGAAKVDVTPPVDKLPKNFRGILDHIFARAIVIDNGTSKAALVTLDAGAIPPPLWKAVSEQVARTFNIPATNLLLTATHTHSVPFGGNVIDYEDGAVEAVKEALARLRPAEMSYGTGLSYINVNRNIIDPTSHRWWEGPNYDGPSDKTVAVVEFKSTDGKPIGVYYNYGVHGVITGTLDMLSGDIQGATSRYIEESLGDDAVAVYSNGPAGDQNPIYFNQTYELRDIRIKDYATRGQDISNSMPPGGQGLDRSNPRVQLLMNQQKQMILSMGQMLGEEVLHVMRANMERPVKDATIKGLSEDVTCPGRTRTDSGRAGYPGHYVDGEPVNIRLSLLRVGDTAIGGVNAEIFTEIGLRFKRESPLKHTMMTTLTNGMANSGYIPNDAAFGYETFEVLSSRLKPGCAETAIDEGLIDMIEKTQPDPRGS